MWPNGNMASVKKNPQTVLNYGINYVAVRTEDSLDDFIDTLVVSRNLN